jgi:hypothetical protein
MTFSSHPRLLQLLRWLAFGIMAVGILLLGAREYQQSAGPRSEQGLKALEMRHLRLAEVTRTDFTPDFTHSISEPLKQMLPHRTDGVVQPLWAWVVTCLDVGSGRADLLKRAFVFQVGLALAFWLLLGITCARSFTLPAALLVMQISLFHGFMPTLAEMSSGTLYLVLFLLSWVTCVYALQRNSLWIYGLVGAFTALAYLTEARVLPLLWVFIFISTVRALWGWLESHWRAHLGTSQWLKKNHRFGLIVLAACFGFIAGPRVVESGELFGQGFYHHLEAVRWLDEPSEAAAWIERQSEPGSVKKLPLHERLSAARYLHEHSLAQIQQRITDGLNTLWQQYAQDGGWPLALLMLLVLSLAGLVCWATPQASHAGQRLHPETSTTVLFILGASLSLIAIAAWDLRVLPETDLHALLPPLALSLIWGSESLIRRARRRGASRILFGAYQAVLWLLIMADLTLHSR